MKTVIQRVKTASVIIEGKQKSEIGHGLVLLCAFGKDDDIVGCNKVLDKIINLRIFSNGEGKFDKSVKDAGGALLIVSQFTLYADCAKGKRPNFTGAANYEQGKRLYDEFLKYANTLCLEVKSGEFGADMLVNIQNDGPVTIILSS
jgi:D-tyrosyl-tRNA(Tyr) deacylase